jgi:putative solute:sodium symporter small subunit
LRDRLFARLDARGEQSTTTRSTEGALFKADEPAAFKGSVIAPSPRPQTLIRHYGVTQSMTPGKRAEYWSANLRLLAILLTIWFIVSFGFGIILVEPLNTIMLGGYPLGFWFAQQGSIYIFVALIFIYAVSMNTLDNKFDVGEDSASGTPYHSGSDDTESLHSPAQPSKHAQYWSENLRLLAILLTIWFVVSFGFGIILVEPLNAIMLGGYPLGFWFAQQGSIYIFVVLIFVYATSMNRLDKKYDFGEE